MVRKVTFKNSRNITLVGSLWPSPSNAIIIMAHGSGGNRFARGLFESIALSLQNEGYNVLSFDFSGHGESEDDIITVKKAIDDLPSAIAFVKQQGYTRIALLGHSLGAYACLASYTPQIETMVLLGALTGPVIWHWENFCSPEELIAMKKNGYISSEVNDGLRKEIKVDADLLKDIAEIDQKKILTKITCPVLIIHGDTGQQELDLLEYSKKGLQFLSKDSKLIIIHGASHLFTNRISEVTNLVQKWYKIHFPL